MKRFLLYSVLIALALMVSGCISAWMAASTGKKLELPDGLPRAQVIQALGDPSERRSDISDAARLHFSHISRPISYVEIFAYKGKINSYDEGGGQATVNALTLGVGEIFMIPMTAADIAKRSIETNLIYVFFDSSDTVIGFMVNPSQRYQPNQSVQGTPGTASPPPAESGAPRL